MLRKTGLLAAALYFSIPLFVFAQTEEEKIINTVQQLLDAIASRDTVMAQSVLLPGGQFLSIREDSSSTRIGRRTHLEFKIGLAHETDEMREVLNEPTVLISHHVAILWASYNFFRQGDYSHRGVDAFSLLKTDKGWKIAGLVYSIEKQ